MLSYSQFLFFSTLILGIMITASSTNWFGCWLGLELNLMSFIPLLTSKYDTYSSEAALKYFLVQAIGSAIILASASLSFFSQQTSSLLILMALFLKSGAAPFHFWFPSVLQGVKLIQGLILMTLQKIAPAIMIFHTFLSNKIFFAIITASILSSLVGGIGGLNATQIRKIMAYSSINHMSWMLVAISASMWAWSLYFIIYCFMAATIMFLFYQYQIFHINQIPNLQTSSPTLKSIFFISFLSLGGLPPLLGFLPKALLINFLALHSHFLWLTPLLFSALLTLFFYLRICFSVFSLSSTLVVIRYNKSLKKMNSLVFLNLCSVFTPIILGLM